MSGRTLLVCSVVTIICAIAQETRETESRLVFISQGPVRGYKDSVDDVFTFYNIPYASAPTGLDKFKAPLPPPTWLEPLEAVNRNIICPQIEIYDLIVNKTIQEDCLVANIYVPNTDKNNLPVAVYVHGGAYQMGFGEKIKPINLVQSNDIIVVTFNYRLGIHGFLCLGTDDAPGNAGMKDQVALLRWVNKNIAQFGGNPQEVTIVGCSAGSASVDLLMLSNTTNGLFNKVILGSGVGMNPWTVQIDPSKTAQEYAKVLNFTNVDDVFALGEFYKTAPIKSLLSDSLLSEKNSGVVFAPCVERYTGVEMFLNEAPIHTLRRGNYRRLPMIYGFTDMEGLIRLPNFEDWRDDMNENFSDYLPVDLQFPSQHEKEAVAQTVKKFYFGNQSVSENSFASYVNYFTDSMFSYGILTTVKFHIENGHDNKYLYEYSFVEDNNYWLTSYVNVSGADHCAQDIAVLDGNGMDGVDEGSISEDYKYIKQTLRAMWGNFIKMGEPVPRNSSLPSWPPVGVDMSPYISLGQTIELKEALLEDRVHFWDNIYARYYSVPQPPMP